MQHRPCGEPNDRVAPIMDRRLFRIADLTLMYRVVSDEPTADIGLF